MKCRICGTECPPGAKLCRDCAAARKRAFAATVTMPLLAAAGVPTASGLRFAPRPKSSRKPVRQTPPQNATPTPTPVAVRRGEAVDRPLVVPLRPPAGSMKAVRRGQPAARSQGPTAREKPARRLPLVPIAGATMLIAVIAILELRTLGGDGRASEPPEVAVVETPRETVATAPSLPAPVQLPVATTADTPAAAQPADAHLNSASEAPPAPTPKPVA